MLQVAVMHGTGVKYRNSTSTVPRAEVSTEYTLQQKLWKLMYNMNARQVAMVHNISWKY